MAVTKPTVNLARWSTDDPGTSTSEPSETKKDDGWIVEKPPYQQMNWLQYSNYLWLEYFEDKTDELAAEFQTYDAYVGAGKGFATLQDAISAASPGWRIFVFDDETIDTTIAVNISDLEIQFKAGVIFTKGTDPNALNMTAFRVKIQGGRFSGYSSGAPIKFSSGGDYGSVWGSIFAAGTVTEIDDTGVTNKPAIVGTISEV